MAKEKINVYMHKKGGGPTFILRDEEIDASWSHDQIMDFLRHKYTYNDNWNAEYHTIERYERIKPYKGFNTNGHTILNVIISSGIYDEDLKDIKMRVGQILDDYGIQHSRVSIDSGGDIITNIKGVVSNELQLKIKHDIMNDHIIDDYQIESIDFEKR